MKASYLHTQRRGCMQSRLRKGGGENTGVGGRREIEIEVRKGRRED